MNPRTRSSHRAFVRQGEPQNDPQDLQDDQSSDVQPEQEHDEGFLDKEELFYDSEQVTDNTDINRIPMTKEWFLEEIKKNPEVVYEVIRDMHELEIKETNRAQKTIRILQNDIAELTAERNAIAVKWALSRDRTDTSDSYRSTKIPDPPMFNNGEDPIFENWHRCEGDARRHISPRLKIQDYRDFGEILSHLKSIFVDPNKARNARRKFNSIKMAVFKDYHTFASEFQYLAVEGRIDRDTWKESFFFFALPNEVQRMVAYVFNNDNRTFKDFTHECAKVADLWADLKKRRNNQNAARGGSKSSIPNKGASSRPAHYAKGEEKEQLMKEAPPPVVSLDLTTNSGIQDSTHFQINYTSHQKRMSREQYVSTDSPVLESYKFIGYETIMNSKVDLITNKMDGYTAGLYVTGIRGTCDWYHDKIFCSYEECDPSGKWDFNRAVWSIRYDNNVDRKKQPEFGFHVNTMKEVKRMYGDDSGQTTEYQVKAFYNPELEVSTSESTARYLSARNDLTNYTGWDQNQDMDLEIKRVYCAEMVRNLWTDSYRQQRGVPATFSANTGDFLLPSQDDILYRETTEGFH
ncbi:uncharacterized protein KD926_008737 [Aspergillus affinis]|uniref:uncharacterized protein n=1 Tax=Aspergillus affinis TaxID=1070780 RepID=UPI0022FEFF1A|nr:uncharacterized protein KD926_008737 [Aspergillus affinis]KAI9045311.1 hypothetical protein KD926_008737 [Aspergillus affinis]